MLSIDVQKSRVSPSAIPEWLYMVEKVQVALLVMFWRKVPLSADVSFDFVKIVRTKGIP